MQKTQTIDWKPLSKKHRQYIKSALHNRMCVAEGAIRSGKTIDHCIIAAAYLEKCQDKIHLATGSTIANAKLNIGDCNGYGLEHLFRGRCRWGKYKDNEALYIQTANGEKVVIFAGGGKADSYKRILGNSYGLWIATEINEHYDSEDSRTSFIKVAFGRQVAANRPFVLWDLNPCNPSNRIYKQYIDAYKEDFVGGYLYQHFTIEDNAAISEERKREIESQYEPGSVWYRRDILGERCVAEGLIYPMYEQAAEDIPTGDPEDYCLSIDYGTMNAFAAMLWEKHGRVWVCDSGYYYSGRDEGIQKTDAQYADALDDLIEEIMVAREANGSRLILAGNSAYQKMETIVDPSAASFITELRKRRWYKVRPADNAVVDGIRETANAISRGYIKVNQSQKYWYDEMSGYVWDKTEDEDRPVKVADHAADATRYFVKTKRIASRRER